MPVTKATAIDQPKNPAVLRARFRAAAAGRMRRALITRMPIQGRAQVTTTASRQAKTNSAAPACLVRLRAKDGLIVARSKRLKKTRKSPADTTPSAASQTTSPGEMASMSPIRKLV